MHADIGEVGQKILSHQSITALKANSFHQYSERVSVTMNSDENIVLPEGYGLNLWLNYNLWSMDIPLRLI